MSMELRRHSGRKQAGPRHEVDDVSVGKAVWTIIGLFLMLGLSGAAGWALFQALLVANTSSPPPVSARIITSTEARLQTAPARDLAVLRAREDRELHGTEWLDRQAGIARIPIEQAMALLLKRSRPNRRVQP